MSFGGAGISVWFEFGVVFLAGALVTAGLSALARWGITVALERRGHHLDRWRRAWFHPERELSRFLECLLILAFLTTFSELYSLPRWAGLLVFALWALRLPADLWTWVRWRLRPQSTLHLHLRGFLLLDLGPLWLRGALALLAAAIYFVVSPVRGFLAFAVGFLLRSIQGCF